MIAKDSPIVPWEASPRVESRCAGDPREMGLSQGTALRESIRRAHGILHELEAFRLEQPRWSPYPLFLRVAEHRTAKALVPALQRANPAMLARLQGIAEGAALPLRSICLMNAMEAFLGSVEGRTVTPPLGACSAIAVRGRRSRMGEPILARNFDYPPLFLPFYTLRESRPRGGFRSLDFLVAPQGGTVDGVNEQGLAITLNYAFVTDPGTPNPLVTMLIADTLASCSTVDEAVRRIVALPRWGAGILMLADAAGHLASVELSNTRAGVRLPAAGDDQLVFTNVCHCSETSPAQVSESAAYSDRAPTPLRGQPVLRPHQDRARRFLALLDEHDALGPEELERLMADHGPTGSPDGASPCVHTGYFATTATFQWYPASRRVRVSFGSACRARYVDLAL